MTTQVTRMSTPQAETKEKYTLETNLLLKKAYIGMPFHSIHPETIISCNEDGTTNTVFRDNKWTLTHHALVITDQTTFDFESFGTNTELNESNKLTCKIIFAIDVFSLNSRSKESRIGTLRTGFSALRRLFIIASNKLITIQDLVSNPNHFKDTYDSFTPTSASKLLALIKTYSASYIKGLNLDFHREFKNQLKEKSRERNHSAKQTPVIPSRIFHARYQNYIEIVMDFNDKSEAIIKFVARILEEQKTCDTPQKKTDARENKNTTFRNAAIEYGLTELFTKHKLATPTKVASYIGLVQYCAKCLVHIYTLVREHEAKLLEEDCIKTAEGWNGQGVYIVGVSTKLSGTLRDVEWIANEFIQTPIKALVTIRNLLVPFLPNQNIKGKYLFLTPSLLPFARFRAGKTVVKGNMYRYEKKLPPIHITAKDLAELDAIDPLGDWQTDKKFKVGKPWRFLSHQFRRTMAVFAAQSGLLDLPELKRLLTHFRELMSLYYQRGCSAAGYNMKDRCPELVREYNDEIMNGEMIMYIKDVLYNKESLHGGHGRNIEAEKMDDPTDTIVFKQTAEQTLKKMKSGLLAWQRTPLGGCASTRPCDDRAHCMFTKCFGCADSVIQVSKVQSVLEVARLDLKQLSPEDFEYRAELRNIQDYENLLVHLQR